ncbi:MAG: glycosyltransferase family 39 protein [Bacteroidales bacterium]|nr:glycosyltransferase family 39 protein [Candidatus Latescibacterota bacterium]
MQQDDYLNLKNRPSRALVGIWIPALFMIAVLIVASFHDSFEEWDGVMQYFAGKELLSGEGYTGWPSHFWPPLYSLLTGLFSLVLSGFQAAKTVSILAGVLSLYFAYRFALELSGSEKIGLLTQAFLFLNPIFFLSAIQAENHMLDTMFFICSLFLLMKILRGDGASIRQFVILGIIIGLAALSRYTSYSLVPVVILTTLIIFRMRALRYVLAFSAGFIVISLPWWVYNAYVNGSPFHTWQYLNIGSRLFPDRNVWWWSKQAEFNGIMEIVLKFPSVYLKNIFKNLLLSNIVILDCVGILTPLMLPAVFDSFLTMRMRVWAPLFGVFLTFTALVCQAFVFEQVYLSWSIVLTVLCVMFLAKYVALSGQKYGFINKYNIGKILIVVLFLGAAFITSRRLMNYLRSDEYDSGQLADVSAISQVLREHDQEISTKYIMATHPSRAYYAGSFYLMAPLYYEGSLEDLVRYEGLSGKVREYAPRYPLSTESSGIEADYLVYDTALKAVLPQFAFLLEKDSKDVPANFILLYLSKEAAVYEILK